MKAIRLFRFVWVAVVVFGAVPSGGCGVDDRRDSQLRDRYPKPDRIAVALPSRVSFDTFLRLQDSSAIVQRRLNVVLFDS